MKSLQMQVEFGQKKAMKKVINKGKNLIHCLNLNSDGGIKKDFLVGQKNKFFLGKCKNIFYRTIKNFCYS